jgi:hypothetical protein
MTKPSLLLLACLPALLTFAAPTQGHGLEYLGATENPTSVYPGCPLHVEVFVGGVVCFPGGHITPTAQGYAAVGIKDHVLAVTSGWACQDLNADLVCGGTDELGEPFCESTPIAVWWGWAPAAPLVVFVDGVVAGAALAPSCGFLGVSAGSSGVVNHS